MTITPPPSATAPAAVTPPPPAPVSTAATLTGTCTPGYFPTGQGAVFEPGPPQGQTISGTYYPPVPAYQLTLANDSGNTADVGGFAVVFYDSNGTELGSDKEAVSETFIAAGQSLTWTEQAPPPAGVTGFDGTANIPDGSATCDLVTWYQ